MIDAWFVDAGLGDAIYEPLPLLAGRYRQGPFEYGLQPSTQRAGWRFEHDPAGSFFAMEFESAAAAMADFAAAHEDLSTSPPTSSFTRFLVAQVREADLVKTLRGCTLSIIDKSGQRDEQIDDPRLWCETLIGFGLPGEGLLQQWSSEREKHEAWPAVG